MTREELVKAGGVALGALGVVSAWVTRYGKGWVEAWRELRQARKDIQERRADSDDTHAGFLIGEMGSLRAMRREVDRAARDLISELRTEIRQLRGEVDDLKTRVAALQAAALENVELRAELAKLRGVA